VLRAHRDLAFALLLCLTFARTAALAAEVSVRAWIDHPRLQVGETADLAVEVSGTQNTAAPEIANADGLAVRYLGPATQISIVNGRMSSSITHHFSVTALKPGSFTIGPIHLDYGGKRYDAGSVALHAVASSGPGTGAQAGPGAGAPAAGAGAPAAGLPGGSSGRAAGASRKAAPAGDQLRLVLSAPKASVYLHERMPLSVRLYVGSIRVSDVQYPTISGDGFALEALGEPAQRREQTSEGIFQVLDFATTLTPLRSGALTVGPAKLGLNVLGRQRSADPFFERFFGSDPFGATRRPIELSSEALSLDVLPLPEAGKPADFSGAVGRFEFAVTAAPRELHAGDPVTVTMTIRGEGSLENVTTPAIAANDALRVYPVQAAIPAADKPATAQEKTFEQVVIPQHPGPTSLPELRFSYFDPTAGAYHTITQPPIALTVEPSAEPAAGAIVGATPVAPAAEALGRDIVFIKDTPGDLVPIGARRYRSIGFWAYQPLPALAWLAAVLYDRRRRRLHGDPRYARFTRAGREARRAIAAAGDALRAGNHAAFYDAVARALSDYLAAKLDLPPGSVTPDTIDTCVRARGLPERVTRDLRDFFSTCERVRFAPTAEADGAMERTLERAYAIVRALERERRLASSLATSVLLAAGILAVSMAGAAWAAAATDARAAAGSSKMAMSSTNNPQAIFFRAGTLYGEERYAAAAAEYEKILSAGLESGHVYFNLGNAYFKAGDVGRALLNYERARRLIPRDPDLRANLAYARSLSGANEGPPLYARLLFPLADLLSSDEALLAASLAYSALMLLLVAARLLPAVRRGTSAAAIVAGLALVVLLGSGTYRLLTLDLPAYAVVVAAKGATVRFEPSPTGTTHFEAKPGSVLRLLAERESWAQVARGDGTRGWIDLATVAKL
jgi:tetratricopeptide (TPR) repeat protein